MKNPEKINIQQQNELLNSSALEQLNRLNNSQEIDTRKEKEINIKEIYKSAVSIESSSKETKNDSTIKQFTKQKRGPIDHNTLNKSYENTLAQVQKELNTKNRIFSKVIHNKIIENSSNVIGSTIARPNAILFASVFAFISTLLLYILAKTIGYSLSGFESILAFIVGLLLGLFFDYLRLLIMGKNN